MDAIATATKGIDLAEYDRNRLIRTVDNALVWAVVEHDMPVLRRECARLLEQQSGDRDFG